MTDIQSSQIHLTTANAPDQPFTIRLGQDLNTMRHIKSGISPELSLSSKAEFTSIEYSIVTKIITTI